MAAIKTLGSDGQLSFGKKYAGRQVVVDEREPGVWVVKVGELVPDNERWLHEPEVKAQLDEALAWAAENPPRETDLDQLEEKLLREPRSKSRSPRSQ